MIEYELLVHKVLTGQANEQEVETYMTLSEESEDFLLVVDEVGDLMDITGNNSLPFDVDVDSAFADFDALKDQTINEPIMEETSVGSAKVITLNPSERIITEKNPIVNDKTKGFNIIRIMKIAAIFLIGAVSIIGLFNTNQDLSINNFVSNFSSDKTSFNYSIDEGISNHVLVDNSEIVLNAGSVLTGMNDFNDAERNVKLVKGEAFFKVAKNKAKPFIVHVDDLNVVVTGTAFDVAKTDHNVSITVEEGSVNVSSSTETFSLVANDKLVFDKKSKTFQKTKVQSKNVFNWTKGELSFESTPLNTVFDDIARFYHIDIAYPSIANECSYTSPVLKDKTLEEVLELVKLSYDLEIVTINKNELAISKLKCNN